MLLEVSTSIGVSLEPDLASSLLPWTDPLTAHLTGIAAGDQSAMAEFYEQTVVEVMARARAVLWAREDAEEVVGDVYLHVWRNATAYDPSRGGVRAWLSVIARHRAIDRFRASRAMVSLDDAQQQHIVASMIGPDTSSGEVAVDCPWSGAATQAIASLTPLRQRLLELAFLKDLTHREIAETVGLALGTVKSHLRRSLHCLRAKLSPQG